MSILDQLGELDGLDAARNKAQNLSVAIARVIADPLQPRKDFDEEELHSLASSISQRGILQPIIVRPEVDGKYVIVAGERRWRAAQLAGLAGVPIVIREEHDSYDQMVENIQRADLKHSETAQWICNRIAEGEKAAAIARLLGRSKAWVSKYASFADLPLPIQSRVDNFGMETALILHKAWKQEVDKTEWFLKTHTDITRGAANVFLSRLLEQELAPKFENASNDDFGTSEDEPVDMTRQDIESGPTEEWSSKEVHSHDKPEAASKPGTAHVHKKSQVAVRCEFDGDTQKYSLFLNGVTVAELADGEERNIDVSQFI